MVLDLPVPPFAGALVAYGDADAEVLERSDIAGKLIHLSGA